MGTPSSDDLDKYLKLRELFTNTKSSIITPFLGKWNHLNNAYLRIKFISKVIDYLAEKEVFENIKAMPDHLIIEAVCNTSCSLNCFISFDKLNLLLSEMSIGLGLLDRTDLGYVNVNNPQHSFDKNTAETIKKHVGYSYSLSNRGREVYQKQEYQILYYNLLSAKISRYVSYIAAFVAAIALLLQIFR